MSAEQEEMDAAAADEEEMDKVDDDLSGDGDGDEGEGKVEYVKKQFVARPWVSNSGVYDDLVSHKIQEKRPLFKVRVSKPRKEFADNGLSIVEKDSGDMQSVCQEFKPQFQKGFNYMERDRRKVLDIGLQAAHQVKRIQTQTYFGRQVNKAAQYDPKDFMGDDNAAKKRTRRMPWEEPNEELDKKLAEEDKKAREAALKLERFIDRTAPFVEAALQSNEIINVFQDDFEQLGDEEAAQAGKSNTTSMNSRQYVDNEHCRNKRVSCIKFHPTIPHLAAMSMVENMDFDARAKISGKSFESYVLILNFKDAYIIQLSHALETPAEVTTLEFHPECASVLFGGCLNGQLIVWDTNDHTLKIISKKTRSGGDDEEAAAAAEDDDDENKSGASSIVKMKPLVQSGIPFSHKNYVTDMAFVPSTVIVNKKEYNPDKITTLMSCSEDGIVNFWNTEHVRKEAVKAPEFKMWVPIHRIEVQKFDGSNELGLSKLLLSPGQTEAKFWGASEDGELCQIDWSLKPIVQGEDLKPPDYVQYEYATEKEFRPTLALGRSPFFPNLLLTVHNFHFALWRIDMPDYNEPIFRSPLTFGAHNTCGAFSPTRPGVIFITKTTGFDVWDFLDQSTKPSLTFNSATCPMFMTFQECRQPGNKQYMAYGDKENGTFLLYEVPAQLKNAQENEKEIIEALWNREIEKCLYIIEQRAEKQEYYAMLKVDADKKRAEEEMAKEKSLEMIEQKELEAEEAYQDQLLQAKVALELITPEELEAIQAKKKKK